MREVKVGGEVFRGEVLREGIGDSLDDWHEEGLGKFSMPRAHVLEVDAMEGGYSAFLTQELPDDILVSYRCKTLPPEGMNNINLISHCQPPERGAWPIVELGRYKGYRAMPNYIVTHVSGKDEFKGVRECPGRQRLPDQLSQLTARPQFHQHAAGRHQIFTRMIYDQPVIGPNSNPAPPELKLDPNPHVLRRRQ